MPVGKTRDYVLNPESKDGAGKAKFFQSIGYSRDEHERLGKDLKDMASGQTATIKHTNPHGATYNFTGNLKAPNGKEYPVLTAWFRALDGSVRLVTAYPGEAKVK